MEAAILAWDARQAPDAILACVHRDLLMPVGRRFHGIEAKAGATVNPDYFRGLAAFDRSFAGALASGGVIYGGERGEARSRWPVWSWRRLAKR